MTTTQSTDHILACYLETALWLTGDESTPSGGVPLEENYSPDDFAPGEVEKARADVERFLADARKLPGFNALEAERPHEFPIGHDLWLTRNGHGAGFWDGDYPAPLGDQLTELSARLGECGVYVGDDGLLYFE